MTNKLRIELILVILLLGLGIFLRLWNLGGPAFADDEFLTVYAAKGFAETGKFVFPGGIEYARAPITQAIIALSIKFFGFSEWVTRFPSVIFSALTIILYYFIGRKINRHLGLTIAGLVSLSPWFISWGKEARDYGFGQFWYGLLIIFLFYLFTAKKLKQKIIFLILLIINFILAFYTLRLSLIFVAVFYAYFLFYFWQKKRYYLLSLFILLPIIIFLFRGYLFDLLPGYIRQTIDFNIKLNAYPARLFKLYAPFFLLFAAYFYFLWCGKNKISLENLICLAFFIPLTILSLFLNFYGNRLQYLFIFSPFFYLTALIAWQKIIPKFKLKNFLFFLLPLVFLVSNTGEIIEVATMKTRDSTDLAYYHSFAHPDWRALQGAVDKNAAIITTQQFAVYHYLDLGRKENFYFLRKKSLDKRFLKWEKIKEGTSSVGEKRISSYEDFKKVLTEYKNGFLIVDYRFDQFHVRESILRYVKKHFQPIFTTGEIKVFRWDFT